MQILIDGYGYSWSYGLFILRWRFIRIAPCGQKHNNWFHAFGYGYGYGYGGGLFYLRGFVPLILHACKLGEDQTMLLVHRQGTPMIILNLVWCPLYRVCSAPELSTTRRYLRCDTACLACIAAALHTCEIRLKSGIMRRNTWPSLHTKFCTISLHRTLSAV